MSLKGKTKQEVVAEFRNAEILEAARKVFARRGFNGASVEEIANEAGVAKGTLYLYYDSKNEIYWAALEHELRALCDELRAEVRAATAFRDKIRAFIATKLSYFEDHRDFFRIYHAEFGSAVAHYSEAHKDFRELYLEQVDILKQAAEQALRRGEIRPVQAGAVAFAINDLTRGLITQRLLGLHGTEIRDDIEFLCEFIWKGIACR